MGNGGKWREIRVCGSCEEKNIGISDSYSENKLSLMPFLFLEIRRNREKAWKRWLNSDKELIYLSTVS